ncbi:unnamed protein product [Candidula unifasciata]|uniref:Thioredoxin domain-containing protein n=1 Tax=Candidula unifasciata TaxID=100452 RepID=A0A8S4A7L8_9EUPU|nr:unnamed protein product [Candidula unifasciata]
MSRRNQYESPSSVQRSPTSPEWRSPSSPQRSPTSAEWRSPSSSQSSTSSPEWRNPGSPQWRSADSSEGSSVFSEWSPGSFEWSPDTEAAIREQWPDSLSTSISPYMFPPTATPQRPGVSNLRTQMPRPEQKHFFPPNPPGEYKPEVPRLGRVFKSEEDLHYRPPVPEKNFPRHPPTPEEEFTFPSRNVVYITDENFKQKIQPMAKGLVYFYNSRGNRNNRNEKTFVSAADTLHHELFLFGAIDCAFETGVCNHYQITETPIIKLFSNGFDVSTIHRPESFGVDALQKFITWAPELKKPRDQEGKDFVEEAARKKQQIYYYKQQSEYYR